MFIIILLHRSIDRDGEAHTFLSLQRAAQFSDWEKHNFSVSGKCKEKHSSSPQLSSAHELDGGEMKMMLVVVSVKHDAKQTELRKDYSIGQPAS